MRTRIQIYVAAQGNPNCAPIHRRRRGLKMQLSFKPRHVRVERVGVHACF